HLQAREKLLVQICLASGHDIYRHQADSLLEIAGALGRESATAAGPVLVRGAHQLNGAAQLDSPQILVDADFAHLQMREIDLGADLRPSSSPNRGRGPLRSAPDSYVLHRGDVDLQL